MSEPKFAKVGFGEMALLVETVTGRVYEDPEVLCDGDEPRCLGTLGELIENSGRLEWMIEQGFDYHGELIKDAETLDRLKHKAMVHGVANALRICAKRIIDKNGKKELEDGGFEITYELSNEEGRL
jgi:hypothetical protein